MKLTQAISADLAPGDIVWRDGVRITVETVEYRVPSEHRHGDGNPFHIVNGEYVAYAGQTWTREAAA
jgi:hypothetical protein